MNDLNAAEKLKNLEAILEEMGSLLVCFSGGIDSAFLLAVASRVLGENTVGMTAVSPSLPASERGLATELARELGARHSEVKSNEMSRSGYVQNGSDRCFHCKSELYDIAEQKRKEWNLAFIANGTNLDDLGDYRPGLVAAQNAHVRSPLVEAQMSKQDVRAAARLIGMRIWDKPAAACLSSRIPYGTQVTRERLSQVESFETALHELGFRHVRVRHHDQVARIEVPAPELPRLLSPEVNPLVVKAGQDAGFRYITADLVGYRTGSLNEGLEGRHLKVIQ